MRISELPGPRGLPFLGNALQIERSQLHITAEKWSRAYGELLPLPHRPARDRGAVEPGDHRRRAARAARRFSPHAAPEARSRRRWASTACSPPSGDAWRRQRPMVMAGFDPGHIKTYFPALVKVTERFERRWQRAAAARRSDRPAGRPDALHGGRHRRARVRRRHQHARVGRRGDPDSTSTRCCPRFSGACSRPSRPGAGWRTAGSAGICRALQRAVAEFIAQARARMEANPALRERAHQPDRGDDRRARHRGQRPRRRRRRRQRAHHAARRRGHHREYARLDDLSPHRHPDALRRAREEVLGRDVQKYEEVSSAAIHRCVHQRDHAPEAGGADPDARADRATPALGGRRGARKARSSCA